MTRLPFFPMPDPCAHTDDPTYNKGRETCDVCEQRALDASLARADAALKRLEKREP